jgi:hypothetical protein
MNQETNLKNGNPNYAPASDISCPSLAKVCGPKLNQGKSEVNTTSTATATLLWYCNSCSYEGKYLGFLIYIRIKL